MPTFSPRGGVAGIREEGCLPLAREEGWLVSGRRMPTFSPRGGVAGIREEDTYL